MMCVGGEGKGGMVVWWCGGDGGVVVRVCKGVEVRGRGSQGSYLCFDVKSRQVCVFQSFPVSST